MIKRLLSVFFIMFTPIVLFANSNNSISLSQTILDKKRESNLSNVAFSQEFIYHIEVLNDGNSTLKNIKLTSNIPKEFKILDIKSLQGGFKCLDKDNLLECQLKELKSRKREIIEISSKVISKKDIDTTNVIFIKANSSKDPKATIDETDVIPIKISEKKSIANQQKRYINCSIDKDNIVVGDEVNLKLSSKTKSSIEVVLDKNLEYIKSDPPCVKKETSLICKTSKDGKIDILAKAIKLGFGISEFRLVEDRSKKSSLPIDIKRSFNKSIPFSVTLSKYRVFGGKIVVFDVELNGSKIDKDMVDIKLFSKYISKEHLKLVASHGDGWSCYEGKFGINCKLEMLKHNTISHLKLDFQAPQDSTKVEFLLNLDTNQKQSEKDIKIDVKSIDYNLDHLRRFSKIESFYDASDLKVTGDRVLCYKDSSGVCNTLIPLPNSKLYQSKKRESVAKLKIDKGDEIVFARLYWMGVIDRNIDEDRIKSARFITISNTDENNITTLESDIDKFDFKNDDDYFYYQASVDVSEYIKSHKNQTYKVSNLACSEGFGMDGSWRLVVVTKNKNKPKKYIELYDGFEGVWSSKTFGDSDTFVPKIEIDLDRLGDKKSNIELFCLGADAKYQDSVTITGKGKLFYKSMNVLVNSQVADIDINSDLVNAKKLTISSKGDKVFVGFVGLISDE